VAVTTRRLHLQRNKGTCLRSLPLHNKQFHVRSGKAADGAAVDFPLASSEDSAY
jgi:hypothetical protein